MKDLSLSPLVQHGGLLFTGSHHLCTHAAVLGDDASSSGRTVLSIAVAHNVLKIRPTKHFEHFLSPLHGWTLSRPRCPDGLGCHLHPQPESAPLEPRTLLFPPTVGKTRATVLQWSQWGWGWVIINNSIRAVIRCSVWKAVPGYILYVYFLYLYLFLLAVVTASPGWNKTRRCYMWCTDWWVLGLWKATLW